MKRVKTDEGEISKVQFRTAVYEMNYIWGGLYIIGMLTVHCG